MLALIKENIIILLVVSLLFLGIIILIYYFSLLLRTQEEVSNVISSALSDKTNEVLKRIDDETRSIATELIPDIVPDKEKAIQEMMIRMWLEIGNFGKMLEDKTGGDEIIKKAEKEQEKLRNAITITFSIMLLIFLILFLYFWSDARVVKMVFYALMLVLILIFVQVLFVYNLVNRYKLLNNDDIVGMVVSRLKYNSTK